MWKSLFGAKKAAKISTSADIRLPTAALQRVIIKQLCPRGVPTLPGNAKIVFEISTDPNPDIAALLEIIEQDEALTAKVLKVANSAYFNRGQSVSTARDALTIIGTAETCAMLSAGALEGMIPSSSPLRKQIWEHNMSTALTAKFLAERLASVAPATAFTAGLLHDLGKLLLLQRYPTEYKELIERAENRGVPVHFDEVESFTFNHSEVGATIATAWNFSASIVAAIGLHHAPWSSQKSNSLEQLIKLADLLAHATRRNVSPLFREYLEQELNNGCPVVGIPLESAEALGRLQREVEAEINGAKELYG